MHFGFMKGKGTTDAIFIVWQMQEKFRAKGKKLCLSFVVVCCMEVRLGGTSAGRDENGQMYV